MEGNYNHLFTNGNFLSSAYLRISENVITNYSYQYEKDPSILVSTFINGKTSLAYGWENTLKYAFFKKRLDITLDANIFYTDISAQTNGTTMQNQGWSWFGKTIVSYKLPMAFTVQVNGTYEAPKIIPQGKTLDVYFMDFSLNKDLNRAMSLNFVVSDVFNTKRFGSTYQGATFDQSLSRRWESRYMKIGFTWRFGETDVSLFRRRVQHKDNGQNGAPDGQDF
jgi:hypothetical protein